MVGQGPTVLVAGSVRVGYVLLFFFKSRLSYLLFLMSHLQTQIFYPHQAAMKDFISYNGKFSCRQFFTEFCGQSQSVNFFLF